VTAGAFEDNLASLRVMEKCGMQPMEHTDTIEYRGCEHLCLYRAIDRQS
jgi:RimJ/RimL family protein N-acetyltransferase